MYNFLKLSKENRKAVLKNAAIKTKINEAILEKDYWICLTLDYLFNKSKYKNNFIFKGGTSLSKCYKVINRMSEDIDLILDWRVLEYNLDEPYEKRSNTKQDIFNKEMGNRTEIFLNNILINELNIAFGKMLGEKDMFYILNDDPQTICFAYPRIYETKSIIPIIRLEIGALASWSPSIEREVSPYISESYPNVFENAKIKVRVSNVERTFWEKATILHHEANRPEHLQIPKRYSRHYYDLYMLAISQYKNKALESKNLLKEVVEFKMKFYPRKWAKYEDIICGKINLVPPKYRYKELEDDYDKMKDMIFGEIPTFNQLMDSIKDLEKEINDSIR